MGSFVGPHGPPCRTLLLAHTPTHSFEEGNNPEGVSPSTPVSLSPWSPGKMYSPGIHINAELIPVNEGEGTIITARMLLAETMGRGILLPPREALGDAGEFLGEHTWETTLTV